MRLRFLLCSPLLLAAPVTGQGDGTPATGPDALAWFEREVRPVLAKRCARCHGTDRQRSGLRVDHLEHMLRGGERGAAVVPGDVARSRLVDAVARRGSTPAMPPREPLPAVEVEVLRRWVEAGAPWPDEPVPQADAPAKVFDLEERGAFWCWQPPRAVEPPSVEGEWPRGEIDRFVLRRLRDAGLSPAPDADAHTWLRRVHLDLTGLPPTAAQIDAFVADSEPARRERAVDALLASPHFGERWARHWLDLVRYAETYGHEHDYDISGAWRYRDHVIRTLNADVPYDRIVREHVAGDLLEAPRLDPVTGQNESLLATAFYWFGDAKHSPVDAERDRASRVDNQIDVLTKTFLGVTVSCARCHDHKFDAITQADYYALAGTLRSSRFVQAPLDATASTRGRRAHLDVLGAQWLDAERASWPAAASEAERYLAAVVDVLGAEDADLPDVARAARLDPARLARWVAAARDERLTKGRGRPLSGFVELARTTPEEIGRRSAKLLRREKAEAAPGTGDVLLGDAATDGFEAWFRTGPAFEAPAVPAGEARIVEGDALRAQVLAGTWLHTGVTSRRVQGVLQSPTFAVERRYLHVRAAGHAARVSVVVEGHTLIRAPIYGGLKKHVDHGAARWLTFDLDMWRGREAYVEIADLTAPDPADERRKGYDPDGWIAVQRVVASDARRSDRDVQRTLLGEAPIGGHAELARRLAVRLREAVRLWSEAPARLGDARAALLDGLARHGVLGDDARRASVLGRPVAGFRDERRAVEAALAVPAVVPAMAEGTALDSPLFVRGNHAEHGPPVRRRHLEILGGTAAPPPAGTGRRELAAWIASADNPLTARVIVNRIWHHLFGRGIVATVDNFGVLGERPTHPELLDWLAQRFVTDGWSIKRAIRRMVLSRTYAMGSATVPEAAEVDGDNRLLHRMRVRRLSGEVLRDAMLAMSGRLDDTQFGPGVNVHLTRFMSGRGRPGSGPLDGNGRRSIYLAVRRNFLHPLMLAFDTPVPFSTVGRRNTSNVPAQSLALRNDPFVAGQAEVWGRALAAAEGSPRAVATDMLLTAFGRAATAGEIDAALAFLLEQRHEYRDAKDPAARAWADLAHALFNTKEFRYVR